MHNNLNNYVIILLKKDKIREFNILYFFLVFKNFN